MNDEATRKWIQGLKRLTTFCQRRYPTDPSRSMDFDGHANAGSGAFGGGGDKVALLTAAAAGDTLAPAPAPTVIDQRGAVKIPQKWSAVLREAQRELERAEASAAAGGITQQQQWLGGKT